MAVLHVKSPNGTSYSMTIVTSGTTESIQANGWCKFPNGLMLQWGAWDIATTSGSSRWWVPLPISVNTVYTVTTGISASGLPQGAIAYNGFNSNNICMVCSDGSWSWWPEGEPFGVQAIITCI